MSERPHDDVYMYVGTGTPGGIYMNGSGRGIHGYRFDVESGNAEPIGIWDLADPTFLAVASGRGALYAACHVNRFDGEPGGAAVAFDIDPASGRLTRLNHQVVKHAHPSHITLDRQETFASVASTFGGAVTLLPLGPGNEVCPASETVVHEGEPPLPVGDTPDAAAKVNAPGVNFPARHPWAGADPVDNLTYPHCTLVDPDEDVLYVADLGMNRVYVHSIDRSGPCLTQREWLTIEGGPRMLAKHPSKPYLFVLTEPGSALTMCRTVPGEPVEVVSTASTLEPGHENTFGASGIAAHPSLDLVFVSNRGDDSLATFSVSDSGLTFESTAPSGDHPRHLSVDPSGRYVLCSNTYGNTVSVLEIDQTSGTLKFINEIAVGTPNCTVFFCA